MNLLIGSLGERKCILPIVSHFSLPHMGTHLLKVCIGTPHECDVLVQVLGDEDKRTKYDRGEDLEEPMMGHGGHGHNFGQGGQTFTFHFEGGFPGGFGFR